MDSDYPDSPEYQEFIESLIDKCTCYPDKPCDGLLAGGFCDDIQYDDRCD